LQKNRHSPDAASDDGQYAGIERFSQVGCWFQDAPIGISGCGSAAVLSS
jgi:hypothetical protein